MKVYLCLAAITMFVGCQSQNVQKPSMPAKQAAHQHGGESSDHSHGNQNEHKMDNQFTLSISPREITAGTPTKFSIMVHDKQGSMLKDLETTHEKLVHLIFIDKNMATFSHLHPEVAADGMMTVSHTFASGGEFYVYADIKPRGKEMETVRSTVSVKGDASPPASLTSAMPVVVTGNGWTSKVTVDPTRVGESTVSFEFKNTEGKPLLDMQPYLGAMGHLVIVNTKDGDYAHAHPDEKPLPPGEVRFMAHFAKPGVYKGWGQFKRNDKVFDVPFVIHVN
ncbi:MAG TPA: hypothetical protein PLN21_02340 [Gemmatales bacterium]|nr:hypothetical protein [Gemmatales bacterium]